MNTPILGRSQLTRLLRIILELQRDRTPNSRQLADLCEVSRRTIFRDLGTIEQAGLQVEYDAARLGYRLNTTVAITHPPLDEPEALALFLLARMWDKTDESGLAARANAGALKLIESLSPSRRTRLEAIAPASSDRPVSHPPPSDRQPIYDRLIEGILQEVRLRLKVRENPETVAIGMTITPICLSYEHGWRLIGQSSLDSGIRAIAIASVEEVILTDEPAIVPPRFHALLRREHEAPDVATEIVLRLEIDTIPLLLSAGWTLSGWSEPCANGRVELVVVGGCPDTFVAWCLGQGERVEVLFPSELRRKIKEAARKIVLRYAVDENQTASTAIKNESDQGEGRFALAPNPDFARVGG